MRIGELCNAPAARFTRGQRRNRNRKTEAEATDLEEVGEIGIVGTVLRLEIGEALELGGDLQHVVHHLPPTFPPL